MHRCVVIFQHLVVQDARDRTNKGADVVSPVNMSGRTSKHNRAGALHCLPRSIEDAFVLFCQFFFMKFLQPVSQSPVSRSSLPDHYPMHKYTHTLIVFHIMLLIKIPQDQCSYWSSHILFGKISLRQLDPFSEIFVFEVAAAQSGSVE